MVLFRDRREASRQRLPTIPNSSDSHTISSCYSATRGMTVANDATLDSHLIERLVQSIMPGTWIAMRI